MPPKKKKGNPIVDGVDTSALTREKLEKFSHNLVAQMQREREERNFFQLERDKLRTFWEITRNQLEEANLLVRTKEREVEVNDEHTEIEIKQNTQQMKHLQYENQTKIGEAKAEMMNDLKSAQEDHAKQEFELLADKRELRRQLFDAQEISQLQMEELKMRHSELLCQEQTRFLREADEMRDLHEKKLQHYVEESEIRHRMEMFELEERKKEQLYKLVGSHKQAFKEIRNYYNDITLNNLALISTIKEQMEVLRDRSDKTEKNMAAVTLENRRLIQPMKEAQNELKELRRKLENYDRDRAALRRTNTTKEKTEKQLEQLKLETEVLVMRCEKLTEERDSLKNQFEDAVMAVQQRTNLKNVLLHREVDLVQCEAEKRSVALGHAIRVAGLEPNVLSQELDAVLKTKNEQLQDLRYELARVCKAHDDLLVTYEAKMVQFGIPLEELGFQPIRTTGTMKLGTGPAGLVAKKCV